MSHATRHTQGSGEVTQQIVEQVRSFNRTVTEGIGVLDDRFMGRSRPLGDSRLLWEIGFDGAPVRALRRRLGLSAGCVTRRLESLAGEELVRVVRTDSGERCAMLTAKGRAEWHALDSRSNALARRILAPLSDAQSAARSAQWPG